MATENNINILQKKVTIRVFEVIIKQKQQYILQQKVRKKRDGSEFNIKYQQHNVTENKNKSIKSNNKKSNINILLQKVIT